MKYFYFLFGVLSFFLMIVSTIFRYDKAYVFGIVASYLFVGYSCYEKIDYLEKRLKALEIEIDRNR